MAWELLTKEFELPIERLWFTVFAGDDELGLPPDEEAEQLWIKAGADPSRFPAASSAWMQIWYCWRWVSWDRSAEG